VEDLEPFEGDLYMGHLKTIAFTAVVSALVVIAFGQVAFLRNLATPKPSV
jgi:hypothetical protein